MAGDWIKLETTTPDKPEILAIAEALKIAPEHALGCLLRVWIWADQQSIDGNALRVTEAALDRIACNAGVTQALCDVGWARKLSTGYALVNFERHNGKTAKNRALNTQRVKRFRNDASVTKPLPEKRREENTSNPPSPLPPEDGNGSAFERRTARILAQGKARGLEPKPGESMEAFTNRIEHGEAPAATPKPAAQSLEAAKRAIEAGKAALQDRTPMPETLKAAIRQ